MQAAHGLAVRLNACRERGVYYFILLATWLRDMQGGRRGEEEWSEEGGKKKKIGRDAGGLFFSCCASSAIGNEVGQGRAGQAGRAG
jgi:hypothetical protein